MTKITHLEIENMTCFEKISFDFSDGINVFIGENGTGKTHVLKVIKIYSQLISEYFEDNVISTSKKEMRYESRRDYFKTTFASYNYYRKLNDKIIIQFNINNQTDNFCLELKSAFDTHSLTYKMPPKDSISRIKTTFIPPKDITENSKGFVELNERRELNFSSIYSEIIEAANIPKLRELKDEKLAHICVKISTLLDGKAKIENGEFYFEFSNGKAIPFTLYSEGLRKFALLKILIENGEIAKDTALIWDEPEANLNPKMLKFMAEILLDLEAAGVQIFLSTHEKALISWLEIKRNQSHKLKYFTLFKTEQNGAVAQINEEIYTQLAHNPFTEAYDTLFDAIVSKDFNKSDERLGAQ
jgi:AAA15 family ATPase/GTPase